ncbi:MAG: apolipoprotein N-acyltransferase [Myxococcota bacterium]
MVTAGRPQEPSPSSDDAAPTDAAPTDAALTSKRAAYALAAAGGVVAGLATPPTDIYPAMFVGLGLFAAALRLVVVAGRRPWVTGFMVGWLWAVGGGLVGLRFVPRVIVRFTDLGPGVSWAAHLGLAAAQALPWGLGAMAAALVMTRLRASLPLAFAGAVLVALSLPTVFLWSPAGLLSEWTSLVQAASLIGERGVSALFAVASGLGAHAAAAGWRRWWRGARKSGIAAVAGPLVGAGSILLALVGFGRARVPEVAPSRPGATTTRMALIHAAVAPERRWQPDQRAGILAELRRQTSRAEAEGVALSVWPEAAYPHALPHVARRAPRGPQRIVGGDVRGPVLFGYIARAPVVRREDGTREQNRFNAATIVNRRGRLQPSYDKVRLLWFGEMVPLGDVFPRLRRWFHRSGSIIPGKAIRPLHLPSPDGDARALHLGILNCYEDTLPDYGRRLFRATEPDILINVTNDAWFDGTAAPELHHRLAVMRALELGRDMVRAVNLGVTSFIDAYGRVRLRRDDPTPGYVVATPERRDATTLYARAGDRPFWLGWCLALVVDVIRRRRRRRARPTAGEGGSPRSGAPATGRSSR